MFSAVDNLKICASHGMFSNTDFWLWQWPEISATVTCTNLTTPSFCAFFCFCNDSPHDIWKYFSCTFVVTRAKNVHASCEFNKHTKIFILCLFSSMKRECCGLRWLQELILPRKTSLERGEWASRLSLKKKKDTCCLSCLLGFRSFWSPFVLTSCSSASYSTLDPRFLPSFHFLTFNSNR